MNERRANQIAAEHESGKHAKVTRFDCWACAGRTTVQATRYESIYPEHQLIECRRCGCQHWKDGRCFASDPVGWPIVREITRPIRGFVSRMTPAETLAAVTAKRSAPEGEQKRWWAE